MAFERRVFVNCPYDDEYLPLLRPLVFTIALAGLQPHLAADSLDSVDLRIDRILELIATSKYGIHDLSRMQADAAGDFSRLNMPFEFGLDVGCRKFGSDLQRTKRHLVLEKEPYRYRRALSDVSGSDIMSHGNDPEAISARVRDWLNNVAATRLPGASQVWFSFNEMMADVYTDLTGRGYSQRDVDSLPLREFLGHMQQWVHTLPRPT